ncbi:hypothetical protein PF003_g15026 [Phytophthora fragariae]|nr:hypothetical protein PF003_g15026 [Phytophthora fragariae]
MSPGSVGRLPRRGVKFPSAEEEDTRTTPRPSHLRPVVSVTTAAMMHSNARARSDLVCATRGASLARSMMKLGITLPRTITRCRDRERNGSEFLLDTSLRKALSQIKKIVLFFVYRLSERRYCGTQRCLSAAVVARDSSCELVRPMSLLYHKRCTIEREDMTRRVTQLVRLNWYFAVGIAIRR